MNEKELRQLINEVTAEIIAEADSDMDGTSDADELITIANTMKSTKSRMSKDAKEEKNSRDAISADEVEGKLSFDDWVEANGGQDAFGPNDNAYDLWQKYVHPERYDDDNNDWYEQRHIDDQDMWHDDENETLADKKFRDSNVAGEKLSFDDWKQLVLDSSTTMTHKEDIVDGFDPDTGEQINSNDAWLKGADPAIYAQSIDLPGAGDERSDDILDMFGDRLADDMFAESKEFTFDKFMKDINSREDKIAQHKKELTENEGDTNARLKQRLYQEDWRNSVKFKGNK